MKTRWIASMIFLAAAAIIPVPAQNRQIDTTRADRAMPLYTMDYWIGTWKLNISKSKFKPGPPLKSGTATIQLYGEGIKCILDPVSAEGQARHGEWMAQYDGKDYPVAMKPYADSISLNKIDSHTLQAAYKREGREILSEKWVVSKDHRELTMTQTEQNPTGKGFLNILVYEKQ